MSIGLQFSGRLVRDARITAASNGQPMLVYTLARRMGRGDPMYVDCAMFGGLSDAGIERLEKLEPSLTRGKSIEIRGRLGRPGVYRSKKDGRWLATNRVTVDSIEYNERKAASETEEEPSGIEEELFDSEFVDDSGSNAPAEDTD